MTNPNNPANPMIPPDEALAANAEGMPCPCREWATEDMPALFCGNGHNPRCEKYVPNVGAINLLAKLVKGIGEWGAEEDGVADFVWDAYEQAKFITQGVLAHPEPQKLSNRDIAAPLGIPDNDGVTQAVSQQSPSPSTSATSTLAENERVAQVIASAWETLARHFQTRLAAKEFECRKLSEKVEMLSGEVRRLTAPANPDPSKLATSAGGRDAEIAKLRADNERLEKKLAHETLARELAENDLADARKNIETLRGGRELEDEHLWASLCRQRDELKKKVALVEDCIDRDLSGMASAVAAAVQECKSRRGMAEGRGSYEWDDDEYRREFGWALDAIQKIVQEALERSGNIKREALKDSKNPSYWTLKTELECVKADRDALRKRKADAGINAELLAIANDCVAFLEMLARELGRRQVYISDFCPAKYVGLGTRLEHAIAHAESAPQSPAETGDAAREVGVTLFQGYKVYAVRHTKGNVLVIDIECPKPKWMVSKCNAMTLEDYRNLYDMEREYSADEAAAFLAAHPIPPELLNDASGVETVEHDPAEGGGL